jgi:hypothetical protein
MGQSISSGEQLCAQIDRLSMGPPNCHELIGEHGYALMMGIGRTLGCVQHSREDGEPPYLLATTPDAKRSGNGEIEFVMGGTATPIRKRYCLPLDTIKKIAVHFLETGERSHAVEWEHA